LKSKRCYFQGENGKERGKKIIGDEFPARPVLVLVLEKKLKKRGGSSIARKTKLRKKKGKGEMLARNR